MCETSILTRNKCFSTRICVKEKSRQAIQHKNDAIRKEYSQPMLLKCIGNQADRDPLAERVRPERWPNSTIEPLLTVLEWDWMTTPRSQQSFQDLTMCIVPTLSLIPVFTGEKLMGLEKGFLQSGSDSITILPWFRRQRPVSQYNEVDYDLSGSHEY